MSDSPNSMPLVDSLRVLHEGRGEAIVVTTMGTGREWTAFEQHPLDFVYVPSSMGQATSVALGLAIAQPDRRVFVCNGDGSMLMNLGSLVTITSRMPNNLVVLIFDNGVYEVTGRQPTPGSSAIRLDQRHVRFTDMASSCGFERVFEYADLESWRAALPDLLTIEGPAFVCLKVTPFEGEIGPKSPGPAWERAKRFRETLAAE